MSSNAQSDVCCALLSKKDAAIRRKELLDVVSPALLDYLCNNAHTMVTDKATSVTVSDILASACGDLRPAMTAVALLANHELVPGGTNNEVSFPRMLGIHQTLEKLFSVSAPIGTGILQNVTRTEQCPSSKLRLPFKETFSHQF